MQGEYILLTAVVAVIAVLGGYALLSIVGGAAHNVSSNVTASKNFLVSLTDPATVPAGTTALYVTYSAIQVAVSHSGSVTVQSLPGSGTVNVLNLENATIVLAATNIPNGSLVTQIKINITNAVITVNGKNYTVVIGEGTITANINNSNVVSGQNSALVDLIPSVTAIQTVDKTIYVLTPSVRAVITPTNVVTGQSVNASQGPPPLPPVGHRSNFAPTTNISRIFHSVTPNLRITSASIVVNGNNTDLSLTVENTGNTSVELNGLMINGSKNVYFPQPPVSLLFRMPAMVMPLPILPPKGAPLPGNFTPPPKFVITFPNGTVMNTTATFTMPSFPPPNSTNYNYTPPQITGHFFLLDLIHSAPAESINSTGVLINVGGEAVVETSTPPFSNGPPPQSQPGSPPPNITIPSGSVTISLPVGTTLYVQFPPGITPPTPPKPPVNQAQNMPIGRLILENGTLGFPPMSLSTGSGAQPTANPGPTGSGTTGIENGANGAVSNAVGQGVSNLTTRLPPGAIPPGYVLAAGTSQTFTLNGLLTLGPTPQLPPGSAAASIQPPFAALISGDLYTINIFGQSGAHVLTQVTAT